MTCKYVFLQKVVFLYFSIIKILNGFKNGKTVKPPPPPHPDISTHLKTMRGQKFFGWKRKGMSGEMRVYGSPTTEITHKVYLY
jgi:hypothetical protein